MTTFMSTIIMVGLVSVITCLLEEDFITSVSLETSEDCFLFLGNVSFGNFLEVQIVECFNFFFWVSTSFQYPKNHWLFNRDFLNQICQDPDFHLELLETLILDTSSSSKNIFVFWIYLDLTRFLSSTLFSSVTILTSSIVLRFTDFFLINKMVF